MIVRDIRTGDIGATEGSSCADPDGRLWVGVRFGPGCDSPEATDPSGPVWGYRHGRLVPGRYGWVVPVDCLVPA